MVRVRVQWRHQGTLRAFVFTPDQDGRPLLVGEEAGHVRTAGSRRAGKPSRAAGGLRLRLAAGLEWCAGRLRRPDWCGCGRRKSAIKRVMASCYRNIARFLHKHLFVCRH